MVMFPTCMTAFFSLVIFHSLWVFFFLFKFHPLEVHPVVATYMEAVALFTVPTIQTITLTMQTVYGTSDQEVELWSWSSLLYSKYMQEVPVNTNCCHCIVSSFKLKPLPLLCPHHSLESCNFDTIDVHDGSNTGYRLLGRLCERNNATFHSTGSYLTVRFRTDGSVTFSGFRAEYRVVGKSQWL